MYLQFLFSVSHMKRFFSSDSCFSSCVFPDENKDESSLYSHVSSYKLLRRVIKARRHDEPVCLKSLINTWMDLKTSDLCYNTVIITLR